MIFFDGIIYRLHPCGGISQVYRQLWKRWEEVEQDACAFVPKGEEFPTKDRLIWNYSSGLVPRRFFWRTEMEKAFKRAKPDIFISTYYTEAPNDSTPEILFVYDMIHEKFFTQNKEQAFIEKKRILIMRAARIVAISENTKQDIMKFYSIPEQRIQVIHLAAAEQFKLDKLGEPSQNLFSRPYILYVGRRNYYKNFAELLNTYISNLKIHQSCDLVVVDKNPWQKNELKQIVASGLQNRIHLVNDVSDQELPKYYQQARVFVFPSRYEGFGIPLLEAFACGTPVIANKTSSLVEIGGDAALYFSETDERASLSQQLEEICFDDQLYNDFSIKGIKRAATFSWDRFVKKFKRVIDKI